MKTDQPWSVTGALSATMLRILGKRTVTQTLKIQDKTVANVRAVPSHTRAKDETQKNCKTE